jgi:hypothetical protein
MVSYLGFCASKRLKLEFMTTQHDSPYRGAASRHGMSFPVLSERIWRNHPGNRRMRDEFRNGLETKQPSCRALNFQWLRRVHKAGKDISDPFGFVVGELTAT